ncbi:hypothetical protein ACFWV1_01610 [Streptomyces sp. NPDC058700]|uniref:hypothetical protein n=1 Tax=unclassified Streptomyces TaxID=2593676 RepID=UPI003664A5D2
MFRTTRALAAFAALAGLVLGLLVCGAAAQAAPAPGPLLVGAAVPGCDPGHPADEGAAGPAVPPRAHGVAELLPALAADRTPCGARPDPDVRAAAPGREPPARVPPSPVELSVLRV